MNIFTKPSPIALICFGLVFPGTATIAQVTWNAEIVDCVPGDSGISCDKKLRVEMGLSYDSAASQTDITVLSADYGGETMTLPQPVNIRLDELLPKVSYPLSLLHEVPYGPEEEVIKVHNKNVAVSDCTSDPNTENPSCGWVYDDIGLPIADSQGFCCNRAESDFNNLTWWRGERRLDQQSTDSNNFSTAHCYRRGELKFSGSEPGAPQTHYAMGVEVDIGDSEENFELTLSAPTYDAYMDNPATQINLAAVVAEEAPFPVPELDNYVLYAPSAPYDHPFLQEPEAYLLLVPREEVSLSGEECDKVGIDFSTFRAQSAYCASSVAGDCLHNQLVEKHLRDEMLLATDPDAETKYLVSGLAGFGEASFALEPGVFSYTNTQLGQHTLLLEIDMAALSDEDADGDGVTDATDLCPMSDLSAKVAYNTCRTSVANAVGADGCTINDDIAACGDAATRRGAFIRCANRELRQRRRQGDIGKRQHGRVLGCLSRRRVWQGGKN